MISPVLSRLYGNSKSSQDREWASRRRRPVPHSRWQAAATSSGDITGLTIGSARLRGKARQPEDSWTRPTWPSGRRTAAPETAPEPAVRYSRAAANWSSTDSAYSALGAPEVGRSSLRCVINPRLKHRAHCRRSARLARSRAADGVSAELCVLDGLGSRTGSLGAAENRNLGVAGNSAATWKDSLIQFSTGGTGSKARP